MSQTYVVSSRTRRNQQEKRRRHSALVFGAVIALSIAVALLGFLLFLHNVINPTGLSNDMAGWISGFVALLIPIMWFATSKGIAKEVHLDMPWAMVYLPVIGIFLWAIVGRAFI